MPPRRCAPKTPRHGPKARRLALGKPSPDVFAIYFNAGRSERLAWPRSFFHAPAADLLVVSVSSLRR